MLERLPDWVERLTAYLEQLRTQPFHPVSNNCALFARGAIEAITGADAITVLKLEMPLTEIGAARVLLEQGGIRGLAEKFFGMPADPAILQARRGDLAIAPADVLVGEDRETIGVVESGGILTVTPSGLWHMPLMHATGFWRLG